MEFTVELYEEPGFAAFWGSVDHVEKAAYAAVWTSLVDVVLHGSASPALGRLLKVEGLFRKGLADAGVARGYR
ncbi:MULTISPECIES: hypothetical protein [Pseudomonas]|uniref:hypothetical protein n=1 Tax=Pseudomonas TaxID=286 RepID=UPI0023621BEA|nr:MULTISPECIES: hypothetical protein [Pseudomonas]WJV25859.1 hypothetical protein PSR66_07480 [Pseudomonas chlororaphis]